MTALTLSLSLSLAVWGSAALAAVTAESVISDFQAQGYDRIEVKKGPTQMKVEAIRGTEKVEVVIDTATGGVLKRETATASIREQGQTGVEVKERARDFVDGSGDDSSDDSSDDSGDDHGSDHDSGDDHGSDHDSGDDHGGDHDGGGDHGGGDHGGGDGDGGSDD
jgi:hypothetical protein